MKTPMSNDELDPTAPRGAVPRTKPRWRAGLVLLLVPMLLAALVGPAQAAARGNAGIGFSDPAGDGRPDIRRVTIDGTGPSAARVKVRVRNVRSAVNNALTLYVDPTGERARPSYAFALGTINSASEYEMLDTNGWRVRNQDLGTCGETVRLRSPSRTTRLIVVKMPFACFSDDGGAKFAVRTQAYRNNGATVGTPDWAPARRQLSERFTLN